VLVVDTGKEAFTVLSADRHQRGMILVHATSKYSLVRNPDLPDYLLVALAADIIFFLPQR
jgi:hypothetical protein